MPIAGLLVDMDGTLVDTAAANFAAYAAALAAVGVAVTRDEFDLVAQGRNWRQFLPELLAAARSDAEPAAVAAHKAELYPQKLSLTAVNEPLASLIRDSRKMWRTALVTTASRANATAVLRHHGLAELFDTIVTGSDVTRHKPDPEAYRIAAARLDLSPAECLVIEDSEIGLASANAFGAQCLMIRLT